VPIVAVTAAAYADDRDRVLAAGLDAHLAKPVPLKDLLDTLGALLPLKWEPGDREQGDGDREHPDRDRPTTEPVPAAPERVSRERAERLQRLTRSGSVTAIGAFAADWLREGGCPVLARRIAALADDFDLAGLRRLAEEVGAAAGNERSE
jgi:CheY-like chemotaxis protein